MCINIKKLKFDVKGELTLQSISKSAEQIFQSEIISDVSDKCLVYYWQLDTYILEYFTCCSFDFLLKGGKVLARYEISAREFLYPTPTLTGKDGVERELLLSRTVHFTVS